MVYLSHFLTPPSLLFRSSSSKHLLFTESLQISLSCIFTGKSHWDFCSDSRFLDLSFSQAWCLPSRSLSLLPGLQARNNSFPATACATILQLASKAFLKTVGFLPGDGHIAKISPNPQLEVPYREMTSHSRNKCFNENLIRLSFSLSMNQAVMHVAVSQENKMILTVYFPRISISL